MAKLDKVGMQTSFNLHHFALLSETGYRDGYNHEMIWLKYQDNDMCNFVMESVPPSFILYATSE